MTPANPPATGGWTSDTVINVVRQPVKKIEVNLVVTEPATGGWSSSGSLPPKVQPKPQLKPKAVPSTAGSIHIGATTRPSTIISRNNVGVPSTAGTSYMPKPAVVVPHTQPATGGWTSGAHPPTPTIVNPAAPAVMPVSTNVSVLPPVTNIEINEPI